MKTAKLLVGCAAALFALPAHAQQMGDKPMDPDAAMDHAAMDHSSMPGMTHGDTGQDAMAGMDHADMAGMDMSAPLVSANGSGTSRVPAYDGGHHGLHFSPAGWMVMVHGYASAQYTDHGGPRGDAELYSTSMLMITGERETGWGKVQLRSMLSLEPTMPARGYPNLFATGETAGGAALVDRQHPHDLFMELAARADFNLGGGTSLFLYGGPVGEPALGPSAFMHRMPAHNNPEPPITHHWFDSTHITYGVVTVGLASEHWQLEGSGFRGAEPDEHRWNIETPAIDSWSVRATFNPSPSWSLQASYGQIHQPEALHPGEDEHRFTSSVQYANGKGFSGMLAFSAKQRVPGNTLTAWLGEFNWDLDPANALFGRIENVANDELFPNHDDPLHDMTFRITKFQLGYARHIPLAGPLFLTLGASGSAYAKPAALSPYYGDSPLGYTVFARFSLGR